MNNSDLFSRIVRPIVIQLLRDNGRLYGFEITQKAKVLTVGRVNITEGALYPLLHKLEADGLVETKQEFVGNRMRKYYSLTIIGKKHSRKFFGEVIEFVMQLQRIFRLKLT